MNRSESKEGQSFAKHEDSLENSIGVEAGMENYGLVPLHL